MVVLAFRLVIAPVPIWWLLAGVSRRPRTLLLVRRRAVWLVGHIGATEASTTESRVLPAALVLGIGHDQYCLAVGGRTDVPGHSVNVSHPGVIGVSVRWATALRMVALFISGGWTTTPSVTSSV